MNSKSIWGIRQNKPSYVVKDLAKYVPEDIVYDSLLKRGVFKWFAVRRDLIKLKNRWKDRITATIISQKACKKYNKHHLAHWLAGYRKGIEDCRREVRGLCHSERWRAPDNDNLAKNYLERIGKEE